LIEISKPDTENPSDESIVVTKRIPLNFLQVLQDERVYGVLLPVRVLNSDFNEWSICTTECTPNDGDGDEGTTGTSGNPIYPIGYEEETKDISDVGIYYFKFNQPVASDASLSFTATIPNSETTDPLSISLELLPPFAYNYNDKLNIPPSLIESKIEKLDRDHIFDYTYVPISDNEILSPLTSKEFFKKSHICNEFVIPQISSITIKTMNKRG
jgi:hypothetical protein